MAPRNASLVTLGMPLSRCLLGLAMALCLLLGSACDIIPPSPSEEAVATSEPQASAQTETKGTIGIHAGHGNGDPGAPLCAGGEEIPGIGSEADITLAVANKVATLLRDVKGYNVVLFRGNDSGAQGFHGDAFVSLHCDQCAPGAEGYKVSRYGGTPGTGLSGSGDASDRLVQALWDQYGEATGLQRDTSPGHFPHRMRNYYLLGWIDPATPGAIIEMGWLSGDWHALVYEQDRLAVGIANGVLRFLGDSTIPLEAKLEPTPMVPTPIPGAARTLAVGDYFAYRMDTESGWVETKSEVTGTEALGGHACWVVQYSWHNASPSLPIKDRTATEWVDQGTGVLTRVEVQTVYASAQPWLWEDQELDVVEHRRSVTYDLTTDAEDRVDVVVDASGTEHQSHKSYPTGYQIFIITRDLQVGDWYPWKTTVWGNQVIREQRISVAAGTFDCYVIKQIESEGHQHYLHYYDKQTGIEVRSENWVNQDGEWEMIEQEELMLFSMGAAAP